MHRVTTWLDRWLAEGRLQAAQHDALSAIETRRRISLFLELNALLYLGVVAFAGGLAWTARTYSDRWGDLAILLPASALVLGCFGYAFAVARPYSNDRVEPPSLVFDYVLYLACLVLGVELGYVEYRFQFLRAHWDYYLLASAAVYFAAAYRFDNRFVLSLGLAALGGWFGVRMDRFRWFDGESVRLATLLYGLVAAALGTVTWQRRFKPHFLDTYLQLSALIVLSTLTWGVLDDDGFSPWLVPAIAVSAVCILGGIRHRRFSFVVYGAFAGYVCVSREILPYVPGIEPKFLYIVLSAVLMIRWLVSLSRQMGREP